MALRLKLGKRAALELIAGTVSTVGLHHGLIGRRMERKGRREGFFSREFSSEEMGNEFK